MTLINSSDRIAIFGASGMAGSSIARSLDGCGYHNLYTPSRSELNLLDDHAVSDWFQRIKPDVVVLAAAKVGGINANIKYPCEFLLDNLKIQVNV